MGKPIENWSLLYFLLKPSVKAMHRLQYRRMIVNGLENIPKNKPVVFAPNHQNGLMDPLAIAFTTSFQPVFLARADIFKSKIIASILKFLKIMPVYRIRDGKDQLSGNLETFETCVRIMKKGIPLCIFPEGAHIGMKSMLPHKKAIPRLVFMVGNETHYTIDLQIIPVGISYSHYYRFRSDLVVNFGQPIDVKPYFDIFQNEEGMKATFALRDRIYNEVSSCTVDVPDKELYPLYEEAFQLIEPVNSDNKYKTSFVGVEQSIIKKLKPVLDKNPEIKNEWLEMAVSLKKMRQELNITETTLKKGNVSFTDILKFLLKQILLFPVALAGAIINGWLFLLIYSYLPLKIKDPQFISTFTFGFSLIMFPLWVIAQLIILYCIGFPLFISVLIPLLSLPAILITWEWFRNNSLMFDRIRVHRLYRKKDHDFIRFTEERQKLQNELNIKINGKTWDL